MNKIVLALMVSTLFVSSATASPKTVGDAMRAGAQAASDANKKAQDEARDRKAEQDAKDAAAGKPK